MNLLTTLANKIQCGLWDFQDKSTRTSPESLLTTSLFSFNAINCSRTLTCSVDRSPFWCSSPSWTHIACQSEVNKVREISFLNWWPFYNKINIQSLLLYYCTTSTLPCLEMHVIMKLTDFTTFNPTVHLLIQLYTLERHLSFPNFAKSAIFVGAYNSRHISTFDLPTLVGAVHLLNQRHMGFLNLATVNVSTQLCHLE